MRIEKLITDDVRACRPDDSLNCAAQVMWECDCGSVPVIDEASRVVGMVTDRDICMAVHTKGGSPQGHRVFEIMSTEIQCCSPQDDLSKAEKLMIVAQVRRLPVCDGEGQLVGLLSLNDIARKAVQEEGKKRIPSSLGASDVVHTLAAIGQPRLVAAGV